MLPQLELTTFTAANLLASMCHNPNPLEFTAIIALVVAMAGGVTVMVPVSAFTIAVLAGTIVELIMAGASIEAISAAIGTQIVAIGGSIEIVSKLVEGIQNIMQC